MKTLLRTAALVVLFGGFDTAIADSSTMMIVPARPRAILMGQDMAVLRNCNLVSYQGTPGQVDPVMHAWHNRAWRQISVDILGNPQSYETNPRTILVFGHPNELPQSITEAARRVCRDVRLIPTLDVVTMITSLNDLYEFKDGEWRALANRYDLNIKDINERRRKYGRYGPPGSRPDYNQAPPPKPLDLETQEINPQPLIEEPSVAPAREDLIPPGGARKLEMDNGDPPPATIIEGGTSR